MELEEAIKTVRKFNQENRYRDCGKINNSIDMVLVALEKYQRLAEANLRDSEEFKNNMCEHRCLLKTELENSISKEVIEKKVSLKNKKITNIDDTDRYRKMCLQVEIDLLQELLEE